VGSVGIVDANGWSGLDMVGPADAGSAWPVRALLDLPAGVPTEFQLDRPNPTTAPTVHTRCERLVRIE
jgi:hypothetical protein